MDEVKTIKGQAWIYGNSLVQDQIMVIPGVDSVSNVVCLIEDIWEDLTSATGTYKTNGKGYFYWEYKQTFLENPDLEVTVFYECPMPKEGLFEEPYDPESAASEYSKYWLGKFKTAAENYEEKYAIQKKVIVFPGTEYMEGNTGTYHKVEETVVKNNDLGDIENLLNLY